MQSKYTSVADIFSAGPIMKRSQEATMLSKREMTADQVYEAEFWVGIACIALVVLAFLVVGGIRLMRRRQRNDIERIELH